MIERRRFIPSPMTIRQTARLARAGTEVLMTETTPFGAPRCGLGHRPHQVAQKSMQPAFEDKRSYLKWSLTC